jgi:hypothetical protein
MDMQVDPKSKSRDWYVRRNLCFSCKKNPRVVGRSYCRECTNTKAISSGNKSYYKRRAIIRKLLTELKNVPCADCGNMYQACAMDFDHVKGIKSFNLSEAGEMRLSTQKVIDLVINESQKCDVVCANCHRVRTYDRRDYCSV